jgi:eukaryotic-like serine/threonine-protein kinase
MLKSTVVFRGALAAAVLAAVAMPAFAAERAARGDKANSAARRAPTVAIVLQGDAALAGPAGNVIGAVAREQGFRIIEGRGRDAEPRDFARRADAVFVVTANPVGTTEVEYYGNVSTLYSAELSLSAWRPSDGTQLWDAPIVSVDFTALNAREKAQESVEPMLADIEEELRRIRR